MWFLSLLHSRTGPSAPNRSKQRRRRPARSNQTSAQLQVEQLEHRWCPSYSLVTSRTALAGTDSVNWGTLGPAGTVAANPSTILSASGHSISVSKTQAGAFKVLEQPLPYSAGEWAGNFAPGDMVLWTDDSGLKSANPITLDFGTTAVAAGGAQIQEDYYPGNFTAEVQAFDASGKILASFTEHGKSTSAADNSAIFIGIRSTSANIYKIALSLTNAHSGTLGDFAINQFDFRTSALAAAPAASAAVVAAPAFGDSGAAAPSPSARQLTSAPQTGSFTASPNPVTAGSYLTLTASNLTDANPGAFVTQLAFSLDSNHEGTLNSGDTLLGYATQASPGVWMLSFSTSTFGLTSGIYTPFAQAKDSDGVFGDPLALSLTVLMRFDDQDR
jgi:hypothetical protein